ncbi:MAG: hypothetical protein IT495_02100 [Gammaproteobacteria bacterium]|nr:hypothetical protein [Gammaproteobacteria bacterium]
MESQLMKNQITLLTPGVDDLRQAVRLYRDGRGLHSEGIAGTELEHAAVGFF